MTFVELKFFNQNYNIKNMSIDYLNKLCYNGDDLKKQIELKGVATFERKSRRNIRQNSAIITS